MINLEAINTTYYRKDMENMSFVGIHNTKSGLIAFADSKASKILNSGQIIEDKERIKIPKLFKNNQFIFVTHGNNELFSGYKKTNIEDYVEQNLSENIIYKDFFYVLFTLLILDKPEYNNGIYNFIIGSKDQKGYYVRTLKFDVLNEIMEYSQKNYTYQCLYGGDISYVKMYESIPKYFDVPIDEYSKIIKEQVECLVKIFDLDLTYNSVGLPINVKIFQ